MLSVSVSSCSLNADVGQLMRLWNFLVHVDPEREVTLHLRARGGMLEVEYNAPEDPTEWAWDIAVTRLVVRYYNRYRYRNL